MRFGDIEIADFRFGDIQPVKLCMGDVEVWSPGVGCCPGPYVRWYERDDTMHEDEFSDGVIPDYEYQQHGNIARAEICGGITAIGGSDWGYVFAGCGNLSSVCISYGVEYIAGRTFENCPRLKNVTIPASVTGIGTNAFYDFDDSCTITFEGPCPNFSMSEDGDLGFGTNIIVPDAYLSDYCSALSQHGGLNVVSDLGNGCLDCDDWENLGYESYEDCRCQNYGECEEEE